jgi:hypothetical protein
VRDTLLHLAQAQQLEVFWSETIFAEVARNFPKVSGSTDAGRRYARLLAALRQYFPQAFVDDRGIELAPPWDVLHDRHVLACALAGPAGTIVTYNLRDFPSHLLEPYNVRARHPDTLLSDILAQRPDEVRAILIAQGAGLDPPRSLAQVLDRLGRDAPRFAAEARQRFGLD